MSFKRVKGTVDFFPAQKELQNWIFNRFRSVARSYSFNEVDVPALETLGLLTRKSGEVIKSQIFTLDKRSREELGLRFELTASLARMFIEKQKELPKPVKWFSIGPNWRYEQPQAGRLREFFQFDVEVFGSASAICDAEVINVSVDALRSLGLDEKDFIIYVNNRKLLQGLLSSFVKDNQMDKVLRVIDKRDKLSEQEFEKELEFLGDDKRTVQKYLNMDLLDIKNLDLNKTAEEGCHELEAVFPYLSNNAVFDLGTARGLAYYTGTVFEIFDTDKKFRALCGGGRYDGLIETFGGHPTPATGFGMGLSTIELLLKDRSLMPVIDFGPDYFVAIVKGSEREALKIISHLRIKNSVAYDFNGRNLTNQLKYANALGAKKLIVIGPDDIMSGRCRIKNMATGIEKSKRISEL